MVERIKALCKEKGTNLYRLEMALGLANGTIKRWNTNTPSADRLAAVASYLCVSMEYLLNGKEKQPPSFGELSEDEVTLIEAFRTLPPDERKRVLGLLQLAAERGPADPASV